MSKSIIKHDKVKRCSPLRGQSLLFGLDAYCFPGGGCRPIRGVKKGASGSYPWVEGGIHGPGSELVAGGCRVRQREGDTVGDEAFGDVPRA